MAISQKQCKIGIKAVGFIFGSVWWTRQRGPWDRSPRPEEPRRGEVLGDRAALAPSPLARESRWEEL